MPLSHRTAQYRVQTGPPHHGRLVPFAFFSTLTTILMDGKTDSLNTDEDYARTHSRCNNWHRQIIVVQNKRQHEEVNVAPMTGQQDYRVLQDSSL